MNVYDIEHSGMENNNGRSIVIAPDEDTAKRIITEQLSANYTVNGRREAEGFTIYNITKINTRKQQIIVVDDGTWD